MAEESKLATFRGEGVGKLSPPGGAKWHGSDYYRTSSSGKLAFLNNIIGLFEVDVDTEGNVSERIREWR
ncbi:MAG: hypothetical protein WBQ25_03155 [Nitrososphaeraceae archaeon]